MNEDIFENIDNILTEIDALGVQKKFTGDRFFATEFNEILGKINEIREYINNPIKDTFINSTSYLINRINNISVSLNATQIPIEEGSSYSIFSELQNIKNKIETNQEETNTTVIDIQSSLNDIELSLGLVEDKIDDIEEEIELSYNAAVESANEYTDEKVEESYNKLYTHINDTTLTFDYDVRTKPEPAQVKQIYNNSDNLYDGSYYTE